MAPFDTTRTCGSRGRVDNLAAMPWKRSKRKELRRGDKVIAVKTIGAIPEGTRGVIKVVDGFQWTRYWVAWETGQWMGTVDSAAVVGADRYEDYKREQAEAAASPPAAVAVAAPEDGGEATAGSASGIPQHLLERSRLARERKAAQSA
jgi:hypothetical protein